MAGETTPVTVLSGTLGAGKPTTLNHVLRESGDLLDAIGGLTRDREFDAVVVESTGVAEPLPVAQTLTLGFDQSDLDPTEFYEETGVEPLENCHLDTTVTVVDAHQFMEAMQSDEILDDDGTKKHLGDLLVEQVEFCDILLLNKCDLVDEETLAEIEATLETLQPRAEIVRTTHGEVAPDSIVDTGRFDFEARRPFHPERFADLLDAFPETVVRSKGHFWLAGREEMEADWEAFDDRFPTFEAAEEATEDETESPENDGQEEIGIAD